MTRPNDAISVQSSARIWAAEHLPKIIRITCGQGSIMLSITGRRDRAELTAAKRALGDWLTATYPERRFLHQKTRGSRCWAWGYGQGAGWREDGLRVGIRIDLTDMERCAILRGPGAWRALEGTTQNI